MENNKTEYDKYIDLSQELIKRGEILKFISTHVNKFRKGFKITPQLINDAREYFKNYSEDSFNFLEAGEYIELNRDNNRNVTSIKQKEYDNGAGTVKRYYYDDEGKITSGSHFRPDFNDRRGIHQLIFYMGPDGKIQEIEGHSRFSKNKEEHVNMRIEDGKINERKSHFQVFENESILDVIKSLPGKYMSNFARVRTN